MFVKTTGSATANIMLVGEAPGEQEHRTGKPFVGPAGHTLDMLLNQAGIVRQNCLIANVAREKPPGNKITFYYEDTNCTIPKPMMRGFIEYLRKEILALKPNIVVALGATALKTLTNNKSIQAARGYICESTLVPGQKVLPTYHPQAVGYQWDLHWQVIMDLRKALANSQTPDLPIEDRVLRASVSKHEYLEYLQWLIEKHKGPIALDIETASPGSHIDIVGIADNPKHAVSFEFLHQRNPKFSLDGELEVWQVLARVLTTKELILQNAAYDSAVLWLNNGILCKNIIADTMIATHVCWPEVPRNLGFQASICLNVPAWKHLQHDMPPYYNCCDAANTYGIWEVLKIEIEKLGVKHTFDAEMAQLEPSVMLQLQGLYVDNEKRIVMEKDTKEELTALEGQIETDIGRSVNFNSPKQMQQLLYVDMGLPMQFKRRKSITESRKLTTDEEAMKKLARTSGNPVLEKIMKAKKLGKLLSSFIDIKVSPESRVHTSYNITGATIQRQKSGQIYDEEDSFKSFGRWSSSASIILPYGSGNLQNIPPAARVFYTAGEGRKYIVGDYVQAEAEVVAYLTNDHKLKKMFQDSFGTTKKERERNNWDVHKMKASDMFRVSLNDVTPDQRKVGKTIRHARNYCVDEKTEVLTPVGWIPFPQLKSETLIAQWEFPGIITFVKPIEVLSFPYAGELYSFRHRSFSQLLTAEHRMPLVNRKTLKYKVEECSNVWNANNGDLYAPTSGYLHQSESIDISPQLARLLCAIQADGTFRERINKREITFTLLKRRKIVRLKILLESLKIDSTFYPLADGRTGVYINGNKYKFLFDFLRITDKKYGPWLLLLSQEALNAIVDESKWWDSRRNLGNNSWQYYSKYKWNCDWMATAAHLTGRRAVISGSHPTVWTTSIQERSLTVTDKAKRSKVPYNSNIYSLRVPSTFYLVRRDGIISVTGNSAGPAVLANKLNVSMKEAKGLIQIDKETCPQLLLWHMRIQNELRQTRTLVNLLGRKHRFLGRWPKPGEEGTLFRSAYSYIPQSTVGDLLNDALVRLYERYGDWLDITIQLHDAIYSIVDEDKVDEAAVAMRECMLYPLYCNGEEFTIDIDFQWGDSWGTLEDLEVL